MREDYDLGECEALSNGELKMGYRWRRPEYLPTPAEIEKKCLEIQRGWTPQERDRRVRCATPVVACIAEDRLETSDCGRGKGLQIG